MTRRRFRAGALGCLVSAVLAIGAPAAQASSQTPTPPRIPARAWILLDADDHARLAGTNPARSLPMASATKLMTAYVTLHELPLDRRLEAPPYHAIPGESLLGLKAGERMSVRDLLYGLLMASGNDAAVTLADGVAGSTSAFVQEMNGAARRLGLRGTSYTNPIGLDEPGNYSSPLDLANLALRLRRERVFRRIVDTARATLRTGAHPRTIINRNDLVLEVPWVNGVKTGYTLDAGFVLVTSATRKGITLLSVVMGASSVAARDADALALLRYGFSLYRRETPVKAGQRLAHPDVLNGDGGLTLVAGHSVETTVRRGQHLDVSVAAPLSVSPPIRRGERIGSAIVTVDGEAVGRAPLLAGRSVSVAAAESLVGQVDDALPGSRALVWTVAAALAVLIVIGIASLLTRRRRD